MCNVQGKCPVSGSFTRIFVPPAYRNSAVPIFAGILLPSVLRERGLYRTRAFRPAREKPNGAALLPPPPPPPLPRTLLRVWTLDASTLAHLQERVERLAGTSFNSCLLNLYRDGKDSLSWHSDNEKPYGNMPKIGAPPGPPPLPLPQSFIQKIK
jgi:hypothetical protein